MDVEPCRYGDFLPAALCPHFAALRVMPMLGITQGKGLVGGFSVNPRPGFGFMKDRDRSAELIRPVSAWHFVISPAKSQNFLQVKSVDRPGKPWVSGFLSTT